ncbi:MAG TPA: heavy-metal-associated domain-containing protein [Bacteriovoracaceae bacterium]|nr:heavy-metal-associated domain-containing protein [Bacteriovoracaceae bacterium]
MKKIIVLSLFLLSTSVFATEITVKVSGMVCSMCAQGIQKKFSKLPAVKDLKVDLDSKVVSINTKDGQNVTDAQIKELITEAGYNVASIERK